VALSHCWGKSNVATTTKESLEEHKKQLPCGRMSNFFQDAVYIAATSVLNGDGG